MFCEDCHGHLQELVDGHWVAAIEWVQCPIMAETGACPCPPHPPAINICNYIHLGHPRNQISVYRCLNCLAAEAQTDSSETDGGDSRDGRNGQNGQNGSNGHNGATNGAGSNSNSTTSAPNGQGGSVVSGLFV